MGKQCYYDTIIIRFLVVMKFPHDIVASLDVSYGYMLQQATVMHAPNSTIYIGCPRVIRADKGTENVRVAAVQYALRREHDNSLAAEKSIRYGSSPANTVHIIGIHC